MIDRKRLLADLKRLLREIEADLRARCDEVVQINADLKKEYEQARAANRVGVAFEKWRADLITQVAAAWVLSMIFVRFLEDNALITPPRISGPLNAVGDGQGLMRARDERDLFFRSHPKLTDRDYLLAVFDELGKLPGAKEIFGHHNLVSAYRDWLSGDAAQKLIEFFQKIDTDGTGEVMHDFNDEQWDTRFLGDLYQDLSEAARKKYALLQTPEFVEEFILERTLEPAVKEFGLKGFKMIDPACGSGHFVLGSFARILGHWRKVEPGTNDRELVNRALAAVQGVDLNPYAVAIARFRLLLAAMKECQVTRLKDAPNFQFSLVCGDSLLHGSVSGEQQVLGFHELLHHYQSEDIDGLRRILNPGQYHAVVANPPYITVKDKALNQAYRDRYPDVCYRAYSLSVPFMQRLFNLACQDAFVGQITSNSFMKREFGKKLVETYLPTIDLTHIIDTGGAYLPGHGTPTIVLLGRQRKPVADRVRAVLGIRGEPSRPPDPSQGQVWQSIVQLVDRVGQENEFVSITNLPRISLNSHPWALAGGGAVQLYATINDGGAHRLEKLITDIGAVALTRDDDVYVIGKGPALRLGVAPEKISAYVPGESVRHWHTDRSLCAIWPYSKENLKANGDFILRKVLWPYRPQLSSRVAFGQSQVGRGLAWYEYSMFFAYRFRLPSFLAFSHIATHNHFVLGIRDTLYNAHAPIIAFKGDALGGVVTGVVGLLNSALACFWLKQVCHNKGSTVDQQGARQRTMPFEDFWEFDPAKLGKFPIPDYCPTELAARITSLAEVLHASEPRALPAGRQYTGDTGNSPKQTWQETLNRLVSLQEELDWECYRLYGLLEDSPCCPEAPPIKLGERAFEIALARKAASGNEETTWFSRHGSVLTTEIPVHWSEDYRKVVQRRIEIIESNRNIALIERPEYKRRWNIEPWKQQQEKALHDWLLDRLESYFDLDGRMNDHKIATARNDLNEPRLTSVAKLAELARKDTEFMQVAEVYTGRVDFDVANLVGDLVAAESVPCLPVLRYKPSGIDKRSAWERMWELQRLEDDVDALFEVERLIKIPLDKTEETLRPVVAALHIDEQIKPQVLAETLVAASYVAEAAKQGLNPTGGKIFTLLTDTANRAKRQAVGDIPVPPKYTSADFLSSDFWRLRGKLDVPKERWVSFPHCEGEDGTLVIAWAGYDHLQLARAIAERYEQAKEYEGRKLAPLLACIGQLVPWLKQWHNEIDPAFGTRMGDYFESYLFEEAKALGMTVAEVMAWKPPTKSNAHRRRKAKS
jgi:hypothetical protein